MEMFTKNYGKEKRHPTQLGGSQRRVACGASKVLLILGERIQVRVESMARGTWAGYVGS